VREAEIQSLVALIRSRRQILEALLFRHGIPHLVPLGVAPHIVPLSEDIETDIHAQNGNELLVTATV